MGPLPSALPAGNVRSSRTTHDPYRLHTYAFDPSDHHVELLHHALPPPNASLRMAAEYSSLPVDQHCLLVADLRGTWGFQLWSMVRAPHPRLALHIRACLDVGKLPSVAVAVPIDGAMDQLREAVPDLTAPRSSAFGRTGRRCHFGHGRRCEGHVHQAECRGAVECAGKTYPSGLPGCST